MKPRHQVSRAAIDLIKRFEGYRRHAAQLPDGRWTIGYGHTLTAREGAEVSEADAEALLLYDLIGVGLAVNAETYAPLDQNQFDALCCFAFSIGLESFRRSAVLKRVNEGDFARAAFGIELWRKAEFEGEPIVIDALVRRRAAEKLLFLTPADGIWPAAPSPVLRPLLDLDGPDATPRQTPAPVVAEAEGDQLRLRREAAPEAAGPVEPEVVEPEPEGEPEPGPVAAEPELPEPPPSAEPLAAEEEPPSPITAAAEAVAARLQAIFPDREPATEREPAAEVEPEAGQDFDEEIELSIEAEVQILPEDELPSEEAPRQILDEPLEHVPPPVVEDGEDTEDVAAPAAEPVWPKIEPEPAAAPSIEPEAPPAPANDATPREPDTAAERRILIDDTAPFEFVPPPVQPLPVQSPEGALTVVFLGILGLAFFAGGVFWALEARPAAAGELLSPLLVGWLAGLAGVGFMAAAVFMALQRLARAAERRTDRTRP